MLIATIAISCDKEATPLGTRDNSGIAFINAAPGIPRISVYVDTGRMNFAAGQINYLGGSLNSAIPSGRQVVNLDTLAATGIYKPALATTTFDFVPGKMHTFIMYDTINSEAPGKARILRLNDDLSLPALGRAKVRVLHLAPTAPRVDIKLFRTTTTGLDSVQFNNVGYIGGGTSLNEAALSAFTDVPSAVYTVRVFLAGTQTLVVSASCDLNNAADRLRMRTLYVTGGAKGLPIIATSFRHVQ